MDGLGDMLGLNFLAAVEVGNGAGDLTDAVIAAGRQAERVKGLPHQLRAGLVQLAEFAQLSRLHIRVAEAGRPGKALALAASRRLDPRLDRAGRLRFLVAAQIVEIERRDLDDNVDAVEQRPGDAREIIVDGGRRAGAAPGGVAVPAAAAGVHRADELKLAGKARRARRAGNGHHAVLKRLAHDLQRFLAELRQFVEKQHALVCERNFARPRYGAAARQAGGGDRVVRAAERPPAHQRLLLGQKAHDRVDLRDLQRLLAGHIRQDGRQSARQHTLAGAGRPHQEHIVRARRGDLQRPLDIFLSLDVPEIRQLRRVLLRLPRGLRRDGLAAVQMRRKLPHVRHRDDAQAAGQRRLSCVLRGNIERGKAGLLRGDGHGQHAVDRPELSLQTQFAQKGARLLRKPAQLRRRQNSQQNWQIVERAALAGVSGREVQRDAADRKLEAAVFDRSADALARLPDRRIRQADDLKGRQAVGDKALHGNGIAADPAQSQRVHATDHCNPPLSFSVFSPIIIPHRMQNYKSFSAFLPKKPSFRGAEP